MPPQLFLDPGSACQATQAHPGKGPIPAYVREFGFVPDLSKILPGDLILISALQPSWGSRLIIQAQRKEYSQEDARWHHAAMFIGEYHIAGGRICEAQILPQFRIKREQGKIPKLEWKRSGVRTVSLYDYVGLNHEHLLRIRRPFKFTINIKKRNKLTIECLMRLRNRYSLEIIPYLWWLFMCGWSSPDVRNKKIQATVCSQLYNDAYYATTGNGLSNDLMTILPADLSDSSMLTDVAVPWLRLV